MRYARQRHGLTNLYAAPRPLPGQRPCQGRRFPSVAGSNPTSLSRLPAALRSGLNRPSTAPLSRSRTSSQTTSKGHRGQSSCQANPTKFPGVRADPAPGPQVQLVLRQHQQRDDGLAVAGRHDPAVRLRTLDGRVRSERWPGGWAGHCRYGAARRRLHPRQPRP